MDGLQSLAIVGVALQDLPVEGQRRGVGDAQGRQRAADLVA